MTTESFGMLCGTTVPKKQSRLCTCTYVQNYSLDGKIGATSTGKNIHEYRLRPESVFIPCGHRIHAVQVHASLCKVRSDTMYLHGLKEGKRYSMYSPACFVKRSLFIIVLNIWITVSFLHQILDNTEMSLTVVQRSMSLLCTYIYL